MTENLGETSGDHAIKHDSIQGCQPATRKFHVLFWSQHEHGKELSQASTQLNSLAPPSGNVLNNQRISQFAPPVLPQSLIPFLDSSFRVLVPPIWQTAERLWGERSQSSIFQWYGTAASLFLCPAPASVSVSTRAPNLLSFLTLFHLNSKASPFPQAMFKAQLTEHIYSLKYSCVLCHMH